MTNETSGISRRTLAKGAAWAVPAVAVASATPVMAQSGVLPPCVSFAFTGNACRRSNEAIYYFGFCIKNNCAAGTAPIDICVTKLTNQSDKELVPDGGGLPRCDSSLEPGESLCLSERVWRAASQGNGVNVYGTVNGGPEMLLFAVDAPQKTDICAPGADTTTTVAPATTTVAPATTTEAPATTTEAPATTTEAPATTTVAG